MTSYQANFASYRTRDRYVGFLFTCVGIGKSNKMSHNFLFISYHVTKLQPSDKNINTQTRMKFQILSWSKSKVLPFFVAFLHTTLCNRKPRDFAKSYRVVQTLHRFCHDRTKKVLRNSAFRVKPSSRTRYCVSRNRLRESCNLRCYHFESIFATLFIYKMVILTKIYD